MRSHVMLLLVLLLASNPIGYSEGEEDPEISTNNQDLVQIYSLHMRDHFKIYSYVPDSYETSAKTYPLIILLDGDWYFNGSHERLGNGGVVNMTRRIIENGNMPEVIIIGIGYPYANQRGRDFVFDRIKFLRFIEHELLEYVENNFRVSDDRTIMGHSDGGYFVMYCMQNYPNTAFKRFIALSGDYYKNHLEVYDPVSMVAFSREEHLFERIKEDSILNVSMFMGVGRSEELRFTRSNREMDRLLRARNYTHFNYRYKSFKSLDHGTVVKPGFEEGLEWVFNTKPIAEYLVNTTSIKQGEYVRFDFIGSSGNDSLSYHWDFGDGKYSYARSPLHQYTKAGDFNVTLTIQNTRGEKDTYTKLDWSMATVHVEEYTSEKSPLYFPVMTILAIYTYWKKKRPRFCPQEYN